MNRLYRPGCLTGTPPRTSRRFAWCRLPVLPCAAAILLAGATVAAGHRGAPAAGHSITTSTPLPPPPIWASGPALARFYALYIAWLQLPAETRPSFSMWLDRQGVINPHLKAQLLALYVWYSGERRVLRGVPPLPPVGVRG
jgi:hypothetical protein